MLIRNFLFHRISEEADEIWPPILPQRFKKIVGYLTKHYQVVLLEDFLKNGHSGKSNRPVATVLFDDGYKDNLEIAANILTDFKCAASFYVVTNSIDKNIPTWTYIVDNLFRQPRGRKLILENDFTPQQFYNVGWKNSKEGKIKALKIKRWLKSLNNFQRLWVMQQIHEQFEEVTPPGNLMMTWDEVKHLSNAGFYIGSHSHTHPMLATLQNEKEISDELEISAARIQQHLGYRPVTISYPIGSWDERVVKISKETGYKYGLAVEQRFYESLKDDKFIIPRVELYDEPWWKTQLRLNGVYQKVKRIVG